MPTSRQLVQSVSVIVATLFLAAFVWVHISTELASGLVGLLAGRLIDQFLVLGKKNGTQLSIRGNLLIQPLQRIFSELDSDTAYDIEQAVQMFKSEIEHKALLDTLKHDAPSLVSAFTELRVAIKKITGEPCTEDEAIRLLGQPEFQRQMGFGPNYVEAAVRRERIIKSSEIAVLVSKIKLEIERLISKFGGA